MDFVLKYTQWKGKLELLISPNFKSAEGLRTQYVADQEAVEKLFPNTLRLLTKWLRLHYERGSYAS